MLLFLLLCHFVVCTRSKLLHLSPSIEVSSKWIAPRSCKGELESCNLPSTVSTCKNTSDYIGTEKKSCGLNLNICQKPWNYINGEWRSCNFNTNEECHLITETYNLANIKQLFVRVGSLHRKCPYYSVEKCFGHFIIYAYFSGHHSNAIYDALQKSLVPVRTADKSVFWTQENIFSLQVPNNYKKFTIVFSAKNYCVRTTQLDLYYFQCPRSSIELVDFPLAIAPNSEVKVINIVGYCTKNSSNKPITSFYMSCFTNGSFVVHGQCVCNPGFFRNGTVCQECDNGYHKDTLGNEKCQPCGRNSKANSNRTICTCIDGFFRLGNQDHDSKKNCYDAAPVRQIIYSNYTDGTVVVHWNQPIRKIGYDPVYVVTYDGKSIRMRERSITFAALKDRTQTYTIQVVTQMVIGNKTYHSRVTSRTINVHQIMYNQGSIIYQSFFVVIIQYSLWIMTFLD